MFSDDFDPDSFRRDRHAFETWAEDDARGLREEITQRKSEDEADPVSGLLFFFAEGYDTGARALAIRAAVFVHLMRPDLLPLRQSDIAAKLGCSVGALQVAARQLRELAPGLASGFNSSRTSKARLVTMGLIRRRRRELALADVEAMAAARRARAAERVKVERDKVEARRLRVARETIALASAIQRAAAEDMAAFDRSMGLRPATEEGGAATGARQ